MTKADLCVNLIACACFVALIATWMYCVALFAGVAYGLARRKKGSKTPPDTRWRIVLLPWWKKGVGLAMLVAILYLINEDAYVGCLALVVFAMGTHEVARRFLTLSPAQVRYIENAEALDERVANALRAFSNLTSRAKIARTLADKYQKDCRVCGREPARPCATCRYNEDRWLAYLNGWQVSLIGQYNFPGTWTDLPESTRQAILALPTA